MAISLSNDNNVVLSVCCITFNHGDFMKQCLDGILMQQTDFFFEILIHDDCSSDNTKEIIEEYANKYPDIIFPVFQKENQYSKGVRGMNARFNFPRAKGKYIALCDGDDYWIDPYKLQKQVDFLEANPEFNMTFHPAKVVNTITGEEKIRGGFKKDVYEYGDVIYKFIGAPTASFLFRNNLEIPDWFFGVYGGDRATVVLNAERGKIKMLNFVGSVYRIHTGGVDFSYKKNKTALPLRNIKEQYVYFGVAKEKKQKRLISKNILYNHAYLFYQSMRLFNFSLMYRCSISALSFLFFKKIVLTLK